MSYADQVAAAAADAMLAAYRDGASAQAVEEILERMIREEARGFSEAWSIRDRAWTKFKELHANAPAGDAE